MRIFLVSLFILCASSVFTQVQVVLDVYPPSCEGCCDGAVDLSIEGCVTPDYTVEWTGPSLPSWTWNLSDVCETGIYAVAVTDNNGHVVQADFEMIIGAAPFTVIENFTIDCVSGGGLLLRCFLFPPIDSLSNGEACVVTPDCWVAPILYTWYDEGQNPIGNSDCVVGLPPGNYFVIVENSEGEQVTFDVPMVPGSDLGMTSQEVCSPIGLSESEFLGFELFPNPANDQLLLIIDDVLLGLNYHIIDLQGLEVMQGRLNLAANIINLNTLRAGGYLVYVQNSAAEVTRVEQLVIRR